MLACVDVIRECIMESLWMDQVNFELLFSCSNFSKEGLSINFSRQHGEKRPAALTVCKHA